jgi:hypothetical protein
VAVKRDIFITWGTTVQSFSVVTCLTKSVRSPDNRQGEGLHMFCWNLDLICSTLHLLRSIYFSLIISLTDFKMPVRRNVSLSNNKSLESVRKGFTFSRDMAPWKLVDSYGRSEAALPSIMRTFIHYSFCGLSQFRLDFDPWPFHVEWNGTGGLLLE